MKIDNIGRVLVFVAHPDDETIGCSGLLQRAPESLVVFAVDGAPPRYGIERRFGTLRKYSETRFQEATRALSRIPQCSFRRLKRQNGDYFVDQHLFQHMPEAFASIIGIASEFSPEVIVSHAFEGGHIDHDACSFLAMQTARTLHVKHLEFPLYWQSESGEDMFQRFRERRDGEFAMELTEKELAVKQRMRAAYETQREIVRVFRPELECFRPAVCQDYLQHEWQDYPFENRRRRLNVKSFLRRVEEFERAKVAAQRRNGNRLRSFWKRWRAANGNG